MKLTGEGFFTRQPGLISEKPMVIFHTLQKELVKQTRRGMIFFLLFLFFEFNIEAQLHFGF